VAVDSPEEKVVLIRFIIQIELCASERVEFVVELFNILFEFVISFLVGLF